MNLKWYRIQQDATTTFLHEGEGVDDSPGLEALQEAVGGLIERIPDYYMVKHFDDQTSVPHELLLNVDGQDISGILVQVYAHEESKLPFFAITERVQALQYIEENISPLSFIMHPHDFILGDVVVCLKNVYEEEQGCLDCANLGEDHPDWMKGMCEPCYNDWAQSWQERSKTQSPSDEQED